MAAREQAWWMGREKNKVILGTWNNDAFQVSLRDSEAVEDPLTIPLLHELLPYFCIPQCGVYGHADYEVMLPLLLVHLPSSPVVQQGSLYHCLPEDLQAVLNVAAVEPSKLDVFILIQSRPCFENAIDAGVFHVNMLYHTWSFQGIDLSVHPEVSDDILMGVFDPNGVDEVAQDIVEQLNGIPVGRTGKLAVYIHGGVSFSPHNAQLGLQQDTQSVHSFYSFGHQPHSSRSVITYHVLCSNKNAELLLNNCLTASSDVGHLLDNFRTLCATTPYFTSHLSTVIKLIESL